MTLLILGLALWYIGHFWKRAMPERHNALGAKAKGISAVVIVLGMVAMVMGYKMFNTPDMHLPQPMITHISLLIIVIAFYFMTPGPKKGALFYKMRHPMLTGFLLWSLAHVLVNPDLGSYVLFGGLALYNILQIAVINRAEKNWQPNPKGSFKKDIMFFGISVVLVLVIGVIHGLLGPSPFGIYA